MSQLLEQAKQAFDEELERNVQEKLKLWRDHVNSMPLVEKHLQGQHDQSTHGRRSASADAYITVYHGTPAENISGIYEDGIKRGREWFGRPPSVYYMTDKEEAVKLAENFVWHERFAIFEARIPTSIANSAEVDGPANRDFKTSTAFRMEYDIDPEWLTSFDVYERKDANGFVTRMGMNVEHVQSRALKEEFITVYLIVAFDEDKEISKEVVFKGLNITDESKNALFEVRKELFNEQITQLSEQMFTGDISLGQYQEQFKLMLREFHSSAAAIGRGGWDEMTWSDWGRLGNPMKEQYRHLQGFMDYISDNRDTVSLNYIKGRAKLYGDSALASATLIEVPFPVHNALPWIPKDDSTICRHHCHCRWELTIINRSGKWKWVRAVWRIGEAEHCETCVERNGHSVEFQVHESVDVPSIIGGH